MLNMHTHYWHIELKKDITIDTNWCNDIYRPEVDDKLHHSAGKTTISPASLCVIDVRIRPFSYWQSCVSQVCSATPETTIGLAVVNDRPGGYV